MSSNRIGLWLVGLWVLALSGCGLFYEDRGAPDQPCFTNGQCRAGLSCEAGICRATLLDGDAVCQPEEKDCDGGWTRSCQGGEWVRLTDCAASGKVCASGACALADGDHDSDNDATELDLDMKDTDAEQLESESSDNDLHEADSDEADSADTADGDPTDNVDAEPETRDHDDADSETVEEEAGFDCSSGPCCKDGHWLAVNEPCLSGQDAFPCTRDTCDAAHACSTHTLLPDKCLINSVCYDKKLVKAGYPCHWCDPSANPNGWTPKPSSEACDDGNACSYGEHCDGNGTCGGASSLTCASETDACGARRTCNGTSACAVTYPDSSTDCNTEGVSCVDAKCNGSGTCLSVRKAGNCLIGGICYLHHQNHPTNICQWCDAASNTWANKPSTEGCNNDGNKCNGINSCVLGSCTQTVEPVVCAALNDCHNVGICETTTGLCTNPQKDDGTACGSSDQCRGGACLDCTNDAGCSDLPDDGNPCSSAVCNTATNTCIHDTSANINKACGSTLDVTCDKPDICDAAGVCQPNYTAANTTCNDGTACTRGDVCNGSGTCAGTSYSCGTHGNCNGATCDCNAYFTGDVCSYCTESARTFPSCRPNIAQVAAGGKHVCLLLADGAVQCWGNNDDGQLGNGTLISSATPNTVTGLESGVTAITSGYAHSCALMSNGTVRCWGLNSSAQIGCGDSTASTIPRQVTGLASRVSAISAGNAHTCAIMSGGAKCWGSNSYYQLGSSATGSTPVDVTGLTSGVTAISAGYTHSCAIVSGAAKCWGSGVDGALGNGSLTGSSYTPVAVTNLTSGVAAIEVGEQVSCAIVTGGAVKCWGRNASGEAGDGTGTRSAVPVSVIASGATALSATSGHVCALVSGGAKCWGDNGSGQLGDGSMDNRLVATDVYGLGSGVLGVSAGKGTKGTPTTGNNYSCALLGTGRIKCWGGWGIFSTIPSLEQLTPVNVTGLDSNVTQVSTGLRHTCALVSGGAQCWGYNNDGKLGDGSVTYRSTPVAVVGLSSGVTAIYSGRIHTCAIASGAAKCWGNGSSGQIGNGAYTRQLTPATVSGLTSAVTAMAVGDGFSCAVVLGGAKCWGYNSVGQLGIGSKDSAWTPVEVSGLASGVSDIVAGSEHACALLSNGAVKCWGRNNFGQLGIGSNDDKLTPTAVTGLSVKVLAIKAASATTCVLLTGGAVKCWGAGNGGALGNGANDSSTTPVSVSGLSSGVTAIGGGSSNFCAILSGGALQCWGSGAYGKLGNGTKTNSNIPIAVPGFQSGVSAVDMDDTHICVLVGSALKCWGESSYGQLGNGQLIWQLTPGNVIEW